ncbi:MAG TPA: Holliday junction branch migration protein RuvA [Candidatus Paceibacterota bacterium]|nr:Holliday junction branch migration protein RuvA [Candidatus Paceibacterota bacterium]
MLHSVSGKISGRGEDFFVIESGGFGFRVSASARTIARLPSDGETVRVHTFLYVREDRFELYGFLDEQALRLFEILNTVPGVGPKTALGILDIDEVPNIMAAIIEKRTELLTKASGIGRRTAERIILDLQGRLNLPGAKTLTEKMTLDAEVEEALVGLGYSRSEVRKILPAVQSSAKTLEGRLKDALKFMGRRS